MSDFACYTLETFKNVDADFVSNHITKEIALQISLRLVNDGDAMGSEILVLWVDKFFHVYRIENFSEENWRCLVELWSKSHPLFTTDALETDTLNMHKVAEYMECLLRGSSEIINWSEKYTLFSFKILCLQLEFVINTIQKFYQLLRNCNNKTDLEMHVPLNLTLHNRLVKVVCEIVDNLPLKSQEDCNTLIQIMGMLCDCVESETPTDIKTVVETWKCIAKLIILCQNWISVNVEDIFVNDNSWAEKPIVFLIQKVELNIRVVYREDTLHQPAEQVEKYLRVTNFFLKLLIQIISHFQRDLFPAIEPFFCLLVLSARPPQYIQKGKLANIMAKYVKASLNQLCFFIYKNSKFKQLLWSNIEQQTTGSCDLLQLYLHMCILDKDMQYCDDNLNFFKQLFHLSVKDESELRIIPKALDEIIERFAALVIINLNKAMEQFFRRTIFCGDFVLSNASTEVLLIVYNYLAKKGESKKLLNELLFWQRRSECFAQFSSNVRRLNVQRLQNHLWNLCEICNDISSCELKRLMAGQSEPDIIKFYVWNKSEDNVAMLSENVDKLLTKCGSKATYEDYYRLVSYIDLLATWKTDLKEDLIEKIMDLLLRACTLLITKTAVCFNVFVSKGFDIMATLNPVRVSTKLHILNYLNEDLSRKETKMFTVSLILFLNSCCTQNDPALRNVARNILVKRNGIISLGIIANVLGGCCLPLSNKQSNTNSEIYKHIKISENRCLLCESSQAYIISRSSSKRARLEIGEGALTEMINDALNVSHDCVEYASRLKPCDILLLKQVIDNIQKAIENSNELNDNILE